MRRAKLSGEWPLSSKVEFEVKIEAKSFILSVQEDMTLGLFILMGTAAFSLFIIWLAIFQNLRNPI